MSEVLFTIGHSTHDLGDFLSLLRTNKVEVVVDVRSSPYSRYNPQFNRESLVDELNRRQVQYLYLGEELGGRASDPAFLKGGQVQYSKLALSEQFLAGLQRLNKGIEQFRIALMCSEEDPMACHRSVLICKELRGGSLDIVHIRGDGRLETHEELEERLLAHLQLPTRDLFNSEEEQVLRAYTLQASKIAYRYPTAARKGDR